MSRSRINPKNYQFEIQVRRRIPSLSNSIMIKGLFINNCFLKFDLYREYEDLGFILKGDFESFTQEMGDILFNGLITSLDQYKKMLSYLVNLDTKHANFIEEESEDGFETKVYLTDCPGGIKYLNLGWHDVQQNLSKKNEDEKKSAIFWHSSYSDKNGCMGIKIEVS